MSAYVDALVKSAKADEQPVAQIVENLILAMVSDLPLLAPAAEQPLLQGLDQALLVAAKSFLDAQVAKLAAAPAAPAAPAQA